MRLAKLTIIATAFYAATWCSSTDRAYASEWGCEVLLCASSSNPSWRGVPACHPPMHRLISAMREPGFSWPTCPEAGAGKPGYEVYDECPAGWRVGRSDNDHKGRGEPNLCIQTITMCRGRVRDECQQTVSMPRPLRNDPYYFDITDTDGITTRHWFNLRK